MCYVIRFNDKLLPAANDAFGVQVAVLQRKLCVILVVAQDLRQQGQLIEHILLHQLRKLSFPNLFEAAMYLLLKILVRRHLS